MNTKPSQRLKAIASIFALSLTYSSEGRAQKEFYHEFLNNSEIVTISGEQPDEHHARVNSIQITHDQFQELRILNPETGATEILEFSNPELKVTYSMPLHGRFLKLEIKKRESNGFRTANLVLASDKSHYVLVRNSFKPFQIFHQTADLSGPEVCWKPAADMINKPAVDPVIDPLLNTPSNIAKKSLSSSCQTPPFAQELDKLQDGIALVVGTRSVASFSDGRFLTCLNDHHLQKISGEMQKNFTESLKFPTQPTVSCIYENKLERGEYSEKNNLIYFRSPWAYGQSLATEIDATAYYADTFFHESLHKAGIEDEDTVHEAVSCCGLENWKDRTGACNDLDKDVQATNARNAQIIASVDKLKGFSDFWIKIEKDTDSHRANVLYDDFFNMLKKGGKSEDNSLAACLKLTGKSQDDCYQKFVQNTDKAITTYFDDDCRKRFADKSRSDQKSICEDLKSSALNIVNTNANSVCDSTKTSAIEKSCLFAVGVGKQSLIQKAQTEGDLLDAPEFLANNPNAEQQMKLRDAFLTSYAKEIPALKTAYNQMKDKYGDETAISLFSSLINFMGPSMKVVKSDYTNCIAAGTSKSQCTKDAQDSLMDGKHGLNVFFRRVCKVAFTSEDAASKPCKDIRQLVLGALKDSVTKTCKTSDPAKQIGVPGVDLTCIFTASDEGQYNLEHYDQLKKEGKLLDADGDMWAYTPDEVKKQAAANASKTSISIKSTHIADQANRQLASDASRGNSQRGSSSAGRSPASAQGPVEAFNPSRAAFDQIAAQVRNDQPSGGRTILNDAAHMMSSLVIPPAQAETRDDTYNMVARVPAAIVPGGSAIAGDLETTRAINVAVVDPLSVFGSQSPRSARAKEESAAKAQSQSAGDRAAASSDSTTNRSPASSSGAAASTTSKNAATAGSKAAASGHDPKALAGEQQGKHLASDSPESLHTRQRDLLQYFKHHPAEALNRLKFEAVKRPGTRSLAADLANDQIQAIDDLGHKHGAEKPQISISYDSQAGVFVGIPE